MTLAIRHEPEARRFVADIDGALAYITYREIEGRILDLYHTYVPAARRGGGIASQLTAHALSYAREYGYRVVPSCPFVAAYIRHHPSIAKCSLAVGLRSEAPTMAVAAKHRGGTWV